MQNTHAQAHNKMKTKKSHKRKKKKKKPKGNAGPISSRSHRHRGSRRGGTHHHHMLGHAHRERRAHTRHGVPVTSCGLVPREHIPGLCRGELSLFGVPALQLPRLCTLLLCSSRATIPSLVAHTAFVTFSSQLVAWTDRASKALRPAVRVRDGVFLKA